MSKSDAGVLRRSQRGRKPCVAQKGISSLELVSCANTDGESVAVLIVLKLGSYNQELAEKLQTE